jgi:DNA-directed RNA polymerase subunit beta'
MVLGLYYITKLRPGAKGEGLTFYGPEEAIVAYNDKRVDIHAPVPRVKDVMSQAEDAGIEAEGSKRLAKTTLVKETSRGLVPRRQLIASETCCQVGRGIIINHIVENIR